MSRPVDPAARSSHDPPAEAHGSALVTVKVVHTLAWLGFAGCIVALPFSAWLGRFALAGWLIGIVAVEVVVLLVNRWRCPLTDVAARYTTDRRANFDIYLPEWLARHNKTIFGTWYVAGVLFSWLRWRGWL